MDSFKLFNEQNSGPNCSRCGKPTALSIVLPRYGDTPAYDIFQCNVCNAVQWVAQKSPSLPQTVMPSVDYEVMARKK